MKGICFLLTFSVLLDQTALRRAHKFKNQTFCFNETTVAQVAFKNAYQMILTYSEIRNI